MNSVLERADAYLRENIHEVYRKGADGTFWLLCGIFYDLDDYYWFFAKSNAAEREYLSMVCDPEQHGFERI